MNTDGNTDAINRHLAEREAYYEQQDKEAELQDLRDEVDTLTAKLAEVTAEKNTQISVISHVAGKWKSRAEAAEALLRNIVSHATCGTMQYTGQSLNDISVKITKIRNEIYEDGKRRGSEAAEAMLPRAYQAGVEVGGGAIPDGYYNHEEEWAAWSAAQHTIRALPTPTIEQLKEMLKENGDETK